MAQDRLFEVLAGAERWLYWLYGAVSGFGYSVRQPLLWLAGLWAGCAIFYALALNGGLFHAPGGKVLAALGDGLGLSFAALFSFLGLLRLYWADVLPAAYWSVQILSAAQMLAGPVLLFLVGLALRNRFRLK